MNNDAESQQFPLPVIEERETIPSEMKDIDYEKFWRRSARNEVGMDMF